MRRILVAADGSAAAERALAFAAGLAATCNAELTILTVSEEAVSEDIEKFSRAENATVGEVLEAETKAALSRARSIAERLQVRQIKTQAETGDPATVILATARTLDADLIVVGKRGRGQLQGLLLGSVSQKLASLASSPLAIVP